MSSKWVEYNPQTGVKETNVHVESEDTLIVRKEEDVTDFLDGTAAIRNSGATDIGIKKGFWHYCSIPLTVQYEMLTKHGVNVHNRNHWPKVFDLVNREYPFCKTTDKLHQFKGQGQVFGAQSLKGRRNSPKVAI